MLRRSTIPNAITVSRIALAPVIFLLLFVPTFPARLAAFVLFLVAAFSDLWDGYLARKHGWISDFGKLFDPIADKLLMVATFVPFYVLTHPVTEMTRLPWLESLPLWVVLVVFGREALITGIRWLAARRGSVMPAGRAGKMKALFQNIFIGATILWFALRTAAVNGAWSGEFWSFWLVFHGTFLLVSLIIAVVLTVYSLVVYLREWRLQLRSVL
ncbi:MAG: CDP-diacylglycerol--glycerol-3-phosphate 3-phosphatidyltransferase [Gemmatimonadetes bacterium]|nr:CDP-diacylglycerol--glycerol-3-phosphate 3-phosphatidyltransferase [Gemmatimonadota bacterium]